MEWLIIGVLAVVVLILVSIIGGLCATAEALRISWSSSCWTQRFMKLKLEVLPISLAGLMRGPRPSLAARSTRQRVN